VIEQYETQVEEAKASNEELQASNEELRSAAEELETGKEELQSVNEELTTVNQELTVKIEELRLANNDFQNLINSSDIGTIFLDRHLQLKMFTPSAGGIFNLLRADIGRPLAHITSHLRYDGLLADARHVLERLEGVEREVQTADGRWHTLRVRPYRTSDDHIEGVVITFLDVTERRHAEGQVRASEERLRLLIDSVVDYAIFTVSPAGLIDSWNPGAERMFGYRLDEILGKPTDVLFTAEDRAAGLPSDELERARRNGRAAGERLYVRKDGAQFYCSGVTTTLDGAEKLGFATVARDLSGPRQAAEALHTLRADVDSLVAQRTGALEAEVSQHATSQRQVANILRKIVMAQEDERGRIARDLHDHLGQQLTALRMTLERHRDQLGAAVPGEDVDRALALTQRIDAELDFLAWELRPAVLDDLGLAAALPRFVREWSEHHGILVEYRSRGFAAGDLPRDAEIVVYRVAQEALNNVGKHAHASRVDVMLETRDGTVILVVEDDGVGFDPAKLTTQLQGIGLLGMQERAGLIGATLQVESAPGEGTSVFLRCPGGAADPTGDA
jgi:PAS domain S-box-containing protein